MNRAFANVTIKTISDDLREFEGWASTPTTDRQNDQLMPEGAKYELPLPFLLDHDSTQVVGEVYRAQVSAAGIRFWARIKKIAEPGLAKDLVDYAWALIKNKLRPVVSVGFRPLEFEQLAGGGLKFTSWEWYELSGVGVAAQPEAKITATKAAKGSRAPVVRLGSAARKPAAGVVKLSGVAKAATSGTLKINTARKWKAGDPVKIVRTAPRVVKLAPAQRATAGLDQPRKSLPVVRLTQEDMDRAKRRLATRVVKLVRR